MTKINAISPRNTMAISAMLMLSAGTAYAQDATVPVTVAPVVAAPAAPTATAPAPAAATAPTIVIPTPAPPVATPAPVAEAETVAPAAAATQAERRAPQARSTAPVRAQSAPARVAAAEPAATTAPPVAAPLAAPETASASASAQAPAQATPADAETDEQSTSDWALPVAGAATLIVLGGVGLALSRRRRVYEEDADFVPPVASRPVAAPQPEARVVPVAPAVAPSAPVASAPALRTGSLATASDRQALIERIVASPPDEANPFTSVKARRRRARIMVQSMQASASSRPAPGDASLKREERPDAAPARTDYAYV